MSKTKQKGNTEIEHLRGLVRELQKENRSIKKEIRRFEKYEQNSQDENLIGGSEDTYPELETKLTKNCQSCGKGKVIETLQVFDKCYGKCNICGIHERIK